MSNFDNQTGGMTGRRALCAAVAGVFGLAMLGGCATHERVIVKETVVERPAPVVVKHMPSPIHEDRGQRPGEGWNWVPGHWKWEGNDWFWVHGKWVAQPVQPMPPIIVEQITVAPSPQHYWVPGHWVWQFEGNGGWFWVKGSWRR